LVENEHLEEYGQEIYDEFFNKTNSQLVKDYLASKRMKHLVDDTDHGAVAAIVQCLVESEEIVKHMISNDFEEESSLTKKLLRRAFEVTFRRQF